MSRYWAEGRTESGHASSTLVLTDRHGLFASVLICLGHTFALSNKVGVARDPAFMSKQQLPASGQKRVLRYHVPPSSLVSMDQHSGYCMATSIHELPASGQKHAWWYYMPHGHSSAWINTVGGPLQAIQPPRLTMFFWSCAETAHRQALSQQSQGLRLASQERSRSPARADTARRLAASTLVEAAQMDTAAVHHDSRALTTQPGSAEPDPDTDAQITVAGHFRLAASAFRTAAHLYALHGKVTSSNHPTLGQTPEAADSVQSASPMTSAPSSRQEGTTPFDMSQLRQAQAAIHRSQGWQKQ